MTTYLVSIQTEVVADDPTDAAEQVRDVIAERANVMFCAVTPQSPDGTFHYPNHVQVVLPGRTYH